MLTKDDRLFLAALAYSAIYGDDQTHAEEFCDAVNHNADLLQSKMSNVMNIPLDPFSAVSK